MAATLKLVSVMMIMCVVLGAQVSEAQIPCSQVTGNLGSCITYLRGPGGLPPSSCCNGIKSVNSAAKTTADRQSVCNCLQKAANSISGINYSLAAALPKNCNVNIPYQISPSTNCKNVK